MPTSSRRPTPLATVCVLALLLALGAALTTPAAGHPAAVAGRVSASQAAPLSVAIDVAADNRPISPEIYGMNYPSEQLAAELRLPLQRWGGNATTRYNYLTDVSNRGSDYFFQNVSQSQGAALANLPSGSSADRYIAQGRRTGTATLMTIPMLGVVARADSPRNHPLFCGFSTAKYGPQQATEHYSTHCGNGYAPDGTPLTSNDPADTSQPADPAFMRGWVQHLMASFGAAGAGGVRYYNLDNEPSLWTETHRDVRREHLGYAELRDRTYAYAAMIKATDPGAQTLGPAEWGWNAYFYSARDSHSKGANPDRAAYGNKPLVQWYLEQMRAYEQQHGTRILDYLDLHYYPQARNVALKPVGDAATQALRLRSTRSLWDPTYADESWISSQPDGPAVRLIPRMRDWVDRSYPGTKLAITEYNWGGVEHLNGALAQADVLGIFGREGVDLATMWDPPKAEQPAAYAFRLYLNYDGKGARFGDISVRAQSSDQERLAVYAAKKIDGSLTLMVINKSPTSQTSSFNLRNYTPAASAAVYRYSAANLGAVVAESRLPVGAGFNASFPAESITLLVFEPADGLGAAHQLYLPALRARP